MLHCNIRKPRKSRQPLASNAAQHQPVPPARRGSTIVDPMTTQSPPACTRCPDRLLDPEDRATEISFWACSSCGRRFTRHEDGELTERWLGPLSLALYGVMFSSDPVAEVDRVAGQISASTEMLDEIALELAHPSQNVSRIHRMVADEAAVRAFLAALLERFRP